MQSLQYLINEVSDMVFAQFLSGVDNAVQISLHQFRDDIVVIVATTTLW